MNREDGTIWPPDKRSPTGQPAWPLRCAGWCLAGGRSRISQEGRLHPFNSITTTDNTTSWTIGASCCFRRSFGVFGRSPRPPLASGLGSGCCKLARRTVSLGMLGRMRFPRNRRSGLPPTDPFRTRLAFRATWGLRFQHPAHFLPSGSMREAAMSAYCTNTGKTASGPSRL
jgi:hypothetical protein